MGQSRKLMFYAASIFVSFFFFGVLQEKITKSPYINTDGSIEKFTYSTSLVLLYCAVNYLLTKLVSMVSGEEDTTPNVYYWILGLVYSLAMVCSILALQFINYPTQVIGKSCKPIPVMIFGVLLGKKTYSLKKYIFVGLVVIGVIMFMYKDVKQEKQESEGLGIGELLVLSSLFMDGVIAAIQERVRADHQTKAMSMMLNMNKGATVYLLILWVFTSEVFKFCAFIQRQPAVIWKLSALSFCGFLGQYSMIKTVTEFGTLPASMIATLRKFFTVLSSVLFLGNSLLVRQWIAAVIIFSGLFLDAFYGKSDPKVK